MRQQAAVLAAYAITLGAQLPHAQSVVPPPIALVQPEGGAALPRTLTLQDALQQAQLNDAQFLAVKTEAQGAHEERVQAHAGLLPSLSFTTQYLGNQGNGVNPNGRFVSMDGVNMYRVWGVLHQELSASVLSGTPMERAKAAELAAMLRIEVAQRGLALTVTRSYYALVTAERSAVTALEAAQQAARFLDFARQRQRAGQVALSDVIKADIQSQLQTQASREASLQRDARRLALAVLVFPTFTQNFTVVDDLATPPPLPSFADASAMAGRNNPELRSAQASLAAAGKDITVARSALFPSLSIDAVYGIEANEFALHSQIAAQPELGVLPNLGWAVTANVSVPVWDWGSGRSRLHQAETRAHSAEVTLSQTQREQIAGLYAKYNESLVAKAALENGQRVAELAAESLRLTALRYTAGESTVLEVVDAQNTLVLARNSFADSGARYRVALADLQTLTGSF